MIRLFLIVLLGGIGSLRSADIKTLTPKAEDGDAEAQYQLAEAYHVALDTRQDFGAALKWAQKAADAGHPMAQYRLASMLLLGEGTKPDLQKSEALFKQCLVGLTKLAEEKNPDACNKLGVLYARGVAVERDPGRSIDLFRIGADAGLVQAFENMGTAYLTGSGVEKNPTEAGKWIEKAAKTGFGSAQLQIGIMNLRAQGRRQDIPAGMDWIRKATECNQTRYAERAKQLLEKLDLFPPQPGPDIDALIKKAGDGDVPTQIQLAVRYKKGDGVRQDANESILWLTEAAYQADGRACLLLGAEFGNQPENAGKKQASVFWRLGAWLGQVNCQGNYAIMCAKGDGIDKDFEQSYHWMLVAGRAVEDPRIRANFDKLRDEITKELDADLILEGLSRARDHQKVAPKTDADRRLIAHAYFGDGEAQLKHGQALAELFPVRALVWMRLAEKQKVDGASKAANALADELDESKLKVVAARVADFEPLKRLRD